MFGLHHIPLLYLVEKTCKCTRENELYEIIYTFHMD